MENVHRARRRQHHRLAPSCSRCRQRKIRCDRACPCDPCARSGHACRYDNPSAPEGTFVPGQHVFSARPPPQDVPRPGVYQGPARLVPPRPQPENAGRDQPAAASRSLTASPNSEVTSSTRLLWHGSRATDEYVSPFDGQTLSVPKEVMFGEDNATVFWGRTHETNFITRITDMTKLLLRSDDQDNVTTLYQVERHTRPKETTFRGWDPELLSLVPPRETSDRLWAIYVAHFESYYRILHIPSFEREYGRFWSSRDVQDGPLHFLAQLLGICAIACCFTDRDRKQHEDQVRTWIEAVRIWLLRLDPRTQMSLGVLQAQLLTLVAGDLHWIKIDRSWISSGILVRNAISAGLHREPRDFIRISPFHADLRRQLWYSILEYDLQASFAKGRMPSVREDEFDCQLPDSPYDLVRAILTRSLVTRSKICQEVNRINLTLDYEGVLGLDAKLRSLLQDTPAVDGKPNDLWKGTLLRIATQRATIALHAPFVARCLYDPKWSYSRARCLETATSILRDALYLRDRCPAGDLGPFAAIANICRCEIANSVFLICHELLARAVERRGLLSSAVAGAAASPETRAVVDLVERVSAAFTAVAKPDIVSQRTVAWMRLSTEFCRAATQNSPAAISTMRESIQKSIQEYRLSFPSQGHRTPGPQDVGELGGENMGIGFEGAADEDYLNLFLDFSSLSGLE